MLKVIQPSPLAPLPQERGTKNNMGFAHLLMLEKGLEDNHK
jgi:hypothetical protein